MGIISLEQGLLISLIALIAGIDFWLEAFFLFRPIIVSTLVGFVLGDIKLGLMAGGLTELVFAGLTPVGGVQPPNPILAGVMVPVLAYITGGDPKLSIGLALPFSILMQYIIIFYYSSFSFFMGRVDKAAENCDTKEIAKTNILLTSIVAISYAVIVFLCVYLAQDTMRNLVSSMPGWLMHGFEVAGGILPAVGFGMLLKILLKKECLAYFIIGFILVSYGSFGNLLPVALIGVALALMSYFNPGNNNLQNSNTTKADGGDYSDGI